MVSKTLHFSMKNTKWYSAYRVAVAPRCSVKKVFWKISQKFTRKYLCPSLQVCNFVKSRLFLWVLRNFSEPLFLQNTSGGCFFIPFSFVFFQLCYWVLNKNNTFNSNSVLSRLTNISKTQTKNMCLIIYLTLFNHPFKYTKKTSVGPELEPVSIINRMSQMIKNVVR